MKANNNSMAPSEAKAFQDGLKALGIKKSATVERLCPGDHIWIVTIDGKRFGLWDTVRETYVD